MRDALLSLVRETLQFIKADQQQYRIQRKTPVRRAPAPSPRIAPVVAMPPPAPPAMAIPAQSEAPSPRYSQMEELMRKAGIALLTSPASIYLIGAQGDRKNNAFLETIASALTERFAPASVLFIVKGEELKELLHAPCTRLVLIPLSFLHTLLPVPQAKIHSPLPSLPCLPLADFDNYMKDVTLKRTLWNTLKTLLA